MWNPRTIDFIKLDGRSNWIGGTINSLNLHINFLILNVYGLILTKSKLEFRQKIKSRFRVWENRNFIMGGDFHNIVHLLKKIRGIQR